MSADERLQALEIKVQAHIEETKEKMQQQGQLFKSLQNPDSDTAKDAAKTEAVPGNEANPDYHKILLVKFDEMSVEFSRMKREMSDLTEKVDECSASIDPSKHEELKIEV